MEEIGSIACLVGGARGHGQGAPRDREGDEVEPRDAEQQGRGHGARPERRAWREREEEQQRKKENDLLREQRGEEDHPGQPQATRPVRIEREEDEQGSREREQLLEPH